MKTQELILVPIPVTTTKREPKTLVMHRDILIPILRHRVVSLDASLRQSPDQIFGQSFAPKPGIDLFLLGFVRRELG